MQSAVKEEQRETVGNTLLVSNEEERVAQLLREQNLAWVNDASAAVHPRDTVYTRYIKRILDVAIALPAFTLVLPINLLLGVCTFLDVGRPIFYRQTRVGKDGKFFTLVKFRNMNEAKDADGKLLPPSQRVTRFGRFVRKCSLDELLSLWNVLKGDMSIIGPRPMPVFITERMSERHKARAAVRPGLECPRVVHFDLDAVSPWHQEFENAVWYVENVSFAADVKLFFLLVKMTFSLGKRSKNAGGLGYFIGYDSNGHATSMKRFRREYPEEVEAMRTFHDAMQHPARQASLT